LNFVCIYKYIFESFGIKGYYCCLLVDEEMDDEKKNKSLKPIGKKLKKKFKLGMKNRRSKGVLRGKRN